VRWDEVALCELANASAMRFLRWHIAVLTISHHRSQCAEDGLLDLLDFLRSSWTVVGEVQ
jgi:hypothetical protein